ncbi:AMP-binding protein [Streptomyces sp. NBRC 109706]|uniref:AMP-binding protein n=1 Tax=Streptomyces sp. NBRC 109706 TaxID=1550035 RepID=UPI0007863E59|nr:AMP-binding protein [Streptomyces sp. NBRC 109706]
MSHQAVDNVALAELAPGVADRSVVGRLRAVALARPTAIALRDDDGALTYAELRERALLLARAVREPKPGGTAPVAVLAPQNRHAVVGFLATLWAGRAAVLLDPLLPDERLRRILAATGADLLITEGTLHDRAVGLVDPTRCQVLGTAEAPTGTGGDDAGPVPGGDAPASIVFTSGSTGRPKGVVHSHDTVVNGAAISGRAFAVGPEDQVAVVLPIAFAAGQETLFMALLNGATAQLRDPRAQGLRGFGDWLRERGVTTLHTTPSLLRSVVGTLDGTYPTVRLLTTCGEAVHGRDVAGAREYLPRATFGSWLGASEIGHLAFHFIAPEEPVPDRLLPVGQVVPSKVVVLVDEDGTPVAPGEPGAVEVRSAFLATGYWDEEAATAERFRPLEGRTVAFRTGDVGRFAPDGSLLLAGRADHAVKIRGYLVEPAEIEAALRAVPEITDAAVAAWGEGSGTRLVAYAVPDGRRRTPSVAALRHRLRRSLPDWMMPGQILLLAELPRTERGKLDRGALPEPPPLPEPTPPADQWEAELAEVWSTVLDVPVGRESSFPLLGGDSLAVEEMLTVVGERLGVSLLPIDLAERPTLREFAALVAERSGAPAGPARRMRAGAPVARLRRGSGPAVLCFSGAGGSPALFAGFAAALGDDVPVHAFAVNGFENRGVPDWTVGATARRYLRLMRAIGPAATEPAALVGHSLGGLFALEVAHRLRAAGAPDPPLVILDTILPPSVAVRSGDAAPTVRVPGFRNQTAGERWATRGRLLGAGLLPYRPRVQREVFFQHGARLTRFHRPRPWDGPAVVFRSLENLDSPAWWDAVLTGPHEIVEVPSDHVGMLKPPYLADVVARVRAVTGR